MTKWEKYYLEQRRKITQFLNDSNISASELMRITKTMCSCGTCYFFTQHYTVDGEALDWGHCDKGNIQHSKKISTSACGSWRDGEEV